MSANLRFVVGDDRWALALFLFLGFVGCAICSKRFVIPASELISKPFLTDPFMPSTATSKTAQLQALIEPVVVDEGCELWGLEYRLGGGRPQLVIFIETSTGVSIEQCERVSRQVSALLDVEDPIGGEYMLEVSSPGIERRLFTLDQYERTKGEQVKLQLHAPFEGQRKFRGLLKGTESDEVILEVEGEEILFPFEMIERAKVFLPEASKPLKTSSKAPSKASSKKSSGKNKEH